MRPVLLMFNIFRLAITTSQEIIALVVVTASAIHSGLWMTWIVMKSVANVCAEKTRVTQ